MVADPSVSAHYIGGDIGERCEEQKCGVKG